MNHFRVQAIAAIVLAGLFGTGAVAPAGAATPVHKCIGSNGEVTFQNTLCKPDDPGARPTPAQLNAERQKKLRQQAAAASSAQPQASSSAAVPMAAAPQGRFKCDGRTHCSQMTSCAEARFFLANCPGAQMDGDKNGIPCERQWCSR